MNRLCLGLGMVAAGLGLAGCGSNSSKDEPPKRPFAGQSVRVGVVGDPGLIASVRAQGGEWSAATSATLAIADKPISVDNVSGQDVVIFPGDRLGELIDRDLLAAWPEESIRPVPKVIEGEETPTDASGSPEPPPDPFGYNDIVAAERDLMTKYGPDRVALPIGGTALVLVYQRSAFESEANKAAAKAAGVTLEPPKNWEALDALARFFHGRDWSGDGKPDSGIALAWGKDTEGVANTTYLARAASLGQHRDQYSFLFDSDELKPRLGNPPFVEALVRLVDLAKLGPEGAKGMDIEAAREAFRLGKVALLVDRAEAASTWNGPKPTPVGVAALPGSPRVYDPSRKDWETPTRPNRPSYLPHGGGWLVGVVKGSSAAAAGTDYAKYLAGPETTNRLRGDKTFPMLAVRSSQLGQGFADPRSAPGVDLRSWADAVGQTLNAVRVVPGLRIPGANDYLDDLSKGRQAALGGKPAAEALAEVSRAWDARTDALGRDRQVWHYRRSLNSLVTLPEPPARITTSK